MRTRISCAIRILLHITHKFDIFDSLKAWAMVGILGSRSASISHMLIKHIMLELRLVGLVQQGPGGDAELWVVYGILR